MEPGIHIFYCLIQASEDDNMIYTSGYRNGELNLHHLAMTKKESGIKDCVCLGQVGMLTTKTGDTD